MTETSVNASPTNQTKGKMKTETAFAFSPGEQIDGDAIYKTQESALQGAMHHKFCNRKAFETLHEVTLEEAGNTSREVWDDSDSGDYTNAFDGRRAHRYSVPLYKVVDSKPLDIAWRLSEPVRLSAENGLRYELKKVEAQEAARARWYVRRGLPVPAEPCAAKVLEECRTLLSQIQPELAKD